MTSEASMTIPAHRTGRTATIKAGEIWRVNHSRKGPLTLKFAQDSTDLDEWIVAEIIDGRARTGTPGDTITVRRAFLTFISPVAATATDVGRTAIDALHKLRLWLAVEGCHEQVEIADDALIASGETHVTCFHCDGAGEWDEGPLPATSSTQISPDYRQVKCPECNGTGRAALSRSTGE